MKKGSKRGSGAAGAEKADRGKNGESKEGSHEPALAALEKIAASSERIARALDVHSGHFVLPGIGCPRCLEEAIRAREDSRPMVRPAMPKVRRGHF